MFNSVRFKGTMTTLKCHFGARGVYRQRSYSGLLPSDRKHKIYRYPSKETDKHTKEIAEKNESD